MPEPQPSAAAGPPRGPFLEIAATGQVVRVSPGVSTVGRGHHTDVRLGDPTVSLVHATIERFGRYVIVADLGLSANGTRVNGRPVGRRLLADGDVVAFGNARAVAGGIGPAATDMPVTRAATAPELTRRETAVLHVLCRPAGAGAPFPSPATTAQIAAELFVTEAAVKQHFVHLYRKFHVPEGPERRTRLANAVVALGLIQPGTSHPDGHTR